MFAAGSVSPSESNNPARPANPAMRTTGSVAATSGVVNSRQARWGKAAAYKSTVWGHVGANRWAGGNSQKWYRNAWSGVVQHERNRGSAGNITGGWG